MIIVKILVLTLSSVYVCFQRILRKWMYALRNPTTWLQLSSVCMYVLYYLHSLESIYKYRTQNGEYKRTKNKQKINK